VRFPSPRESRMLHSSPPRPNATRIAIVLTEFSSGGSERVAIRLANQWASAGRSVTIFCGREDGPTRDLVDRAVAVRPILPRFGPSMPSRTQLGRLFAQQLGGSPFDVIVGPGNYHLPILSALSAALPATRPAIVCKISNPLIRDDRSRLRQALFNAGLRRHARRFDALVAMSPALKREAQAVLPRATIACAAEPTLDRVGPSPERSRSGLVLCIGRLVAQKNLEMALEAFARLPGDYRLAVLGEGEQLSALTSRAWKLGISTRVTFEGFVSDVAPWLARADVLLATSRYEGYPAALIEALAAGVPVVTTPCSPALPEIMLDPSFGQVVAPDPFLLSQALGTVLQGGMKPDIAVMERLIQRHMVDRAAGEWLAILDDAVARRTSQATAASWRKGQALLATQRRAPLIPMLPN
jgi:glycosyltransferase involved in cell wall biosynthesis